MTEEKGRPENTPPGASQPDKKTEDQKSLTDKNSDLIAGTLKFQQTKEQKTMENPVETQKTSPILGTPEYARDEFLKIKKALVGPEKEWCLPKVDKEALASSPQLDELPLGEDCKPKNQVLK